MNPLEHIALLKKHVARKAISRVYEDWDLIITWKKQIIIIRDFSRMFINYYLIFFAYERKERKGR